MNKGLLIPVSILCALLLQTSVIPVYFAPAFKPDLLLIVMVFLALRNPYPFSAPTAWGIGLLKDIFTGLYLGLSAFSFLIIHSVIRHISDRLYAESDSVFVVSVVVSTLAGVLINLILLMMFTATPGISYTVLTGLFPHLLVNAFIASLLALLPIFPEPQSRT